MSENELQAKVRELRSLQALVDEAEREIEALKDEIKGFMGEREELRAGEYKIRYKAVTSSKIDVSAFQKSLPELAEHFIKKTTYRRFSIA